MDKYEYTIKSEKIKKLVERKDYETAAKIADTIDWERVKNVKLLSTVSLAYEKAGRYEEAKDMLLMAYDRAPVGRRFLSKLTELAVKQGNFEEAEDYLKEFTTASPQDPSRLVLLYEIAKAKGEPVERLIMILEAYQKRDFEEKWSYELAELYYRAGKVEECVKLCDEIVLWFGVGIYVDKALELKQRIMPLSPEQVERQENKEKYLRRLEDIRRQFERTEGKAAEAKGKEREEGTKSVAELAVEALREQAVTMQVSGEALQEEVQADAIDNAQTGGVLNLTTREKNKIRSIQEARLRQSEQIKASQLRESEQDEAEEAGLREEQISQAEQIKRQEEQEKLRRQKEEYRRAKEEARIREEALTREIEERAAQEVANLQAEMEASLAREIETEAMAATINEAMLRKTAATMEEVGAVENDHSDAYERTKVASGPFSERTKTKEFVIQARAICKAIEESGTDRFLTEREVEARIAAEMAGSEEVQTEADSDSESEEAAEATVEAPEATAEVAEETEKVPEETAEALEEAAKVPEETAEAPEEATEMPEETAKVSEEIQPVASIANDSKEPVKMPEETQPAAEMLDQSAAAEPQFGEVQDHYVLVASDNEESGLHECVAYIRKMRELLGCPASQMAKISGSKLATKNIEKILVKLQGRDLIIVGIAELTTAVLSQTIAFMEKDGTECFIALIDTEEEVERLRGRMAFFADCKVLSCDGGRRRSQPEQGPELEEERKPQNRVKQEQVPPEPETQSVSERNLEEKLQSASERNLEQKPQSASEQNLEQKPQPASERNPEEKSQPASESKSEPEVRPAPELKSAREAKPVPESRPVEESKPSQELPASEERTHRTLAQLVEEALNAGGQAAGSAGSAAETQEETVATRLEAEYDTKAEEPKTNGEAVKAGASDEDNWQPAETVQEGGSEKDNLASEEEMSPNDFFDFAVEYARMLDAVVDDMGGLALFAEIEECQQERIPLTEELAQELVEKAILRAERRSIKSFFSNRYDKEGYLILKEEHFKE